MEFSSACLLFQTVTDVKTQRYMYCTSQTSEHEYTLSSNMHSYRKCSIPLMAVFNQFHMLVGVS